MLTQSEKMVMAKNMVQGLAQSMKDNGGETLRQFPNPFGPGIVTLYARNMIEDIRGKQDGLKIVLDFDRPDSNLYKNTEIHRKLGRSWTEEDAAKMVENMITETEKKVYGNKARS